MNSQDPRIAELTQLAREELIRLPYPPHYIIDLEDRGHVVDLVSGEIYHDVLPVPTPSARAVAHLLADVEGVFPL